MVPLLAVGALAAAAAAPIYAVFEHAWPDADERSLRQAADSWERFAGDLRSAVAACATTRNRVTSAHKGAAADAFTVHMGLYDGRQGNASLTSAAALCDEIVKQLRDFVDEVDRAKTKLANAAADIGAALAVTLAGVGLVSLLTVGIGGPGALAAWVLNGMRMAYTAVAAATSAYVAVAVVGAGVIAGSAALGAVESFICSLLAQQIKRDHNFSLAEALDAAKWGGILGPPATAAGAGIGAGIGALSRGVRAGSEGAIEAAPGGAVAEDAGGAVAARALRPMYRGEVHLTTTIGSATERRHLLDVYHINAVVEEPAEIRTVSGPPTAGLSEDEAQNTMHFVINSRTGHTVNEISEITGSHDVVFSPESLFHVTENRYEPGLGLVIELDDVTGLTAADIVGRQDEIGGGWFTP